MKHPSISTAIQAMQEFLFHEEIRNEKELQTVFDFNPHQLESVRKIKNKYKDMVDSNTGQKVIAIELLEKISFLKKAEVTPYYVWDFVEKEWQRFLQYKNISPVPILEKLREKHNNKDFELEDFRWMLENSSIVIDDFEIKYIRLYDGVLLLTKY